MVPTGRRARLNPSVAADPERVRQLEARLAALEQRSATAGGAAFRKKNKKNKTKNARPLSSPHTNMMQWSTSS